MRAELRAPRRLVHEPPQRIQKRIYPCLPQRGAEQARKHPPVRDERGDLRVGKRSGGEIAFHQRLVGQGKFLKQLRLRLRKINAALVQLRADSGKQRVPIRRLHVHFVEEQNDWHLIAPQQPPERDGVTLDARRAADNEHGAVEHL